MLTMKHAYGSAWCFSACWLRFQHCYKRAVVADFSALLGRGEHFLGAERRVKGCEAAV